MQFMVTITFNPEQRDAIMPLIHDEQTRVKQLMEPRVVDAIYIGADQSHVWLVMRGA